MQALTRLLLVGLLGCSSEPGPSQHELYLQAFEAGDPALCGALADPALRRECQVSGAGELAGAGHAEAALQICEGLDGGAWRDECFFLVADQLGALREEAQAICQRAGSFRQQCLGHAIGREVGEVFVELGPEAFDRLLPELELRVGRYIGGEEVAHKARRLAAAHIAALEPEARLSLEHCGTAPAALCQEAYVERLQQRTLLVNGEGDSSWRLACGSRVEVERVESLGLPGWEPELDAVAQAAWTALCRARDPHKRRERPHEAPPPRD